MKNRQENGPYNIYAETELTVEFYHCDPMDVVWNGNYFNFFEAGRRVLLEKLEYTYGDMKESGYAFPLIETSAKFIGYLKYQDRAIVKAILEEYENRLKIKFEIRNAKTGQLTTKGVSTQMAINVNTMESCFVCPQILFDKIDALIKKKINNEKMMM